MEFQVKIGLVNLAMKEQLIIFMKIREKNGLLIQMQCLYFMIIHLITIIIEEQMLMHLGVLIAKLRN